MSEESEVTGIKSASQFDVDDPTAMAKLWDVEMKAADEALEKFHDDGKKINKIFLAMQEDGQGRRRVNLFTANVQTLKSLTYGNIPKADVTRRWGDPNDTVGRASGEALRRLLNTDIDRDGDSTVEVLQSVLMDRLLAGLGADRVRYVVETEKVAAVPAQTRDVPCECGGLPQCPECQGAGTRKEEIPGTAIPEHDEKSHEDVETDHIHWDDLRYSPCRTWAEVRWVAFKVPMTKEAIEEKWPETKDDPVPLNGRSVKKAADLLKPDPWGRADVWEIWDKERKKRWWWVKGYSKVLGVDDDPLGLDGFFPCPKPLFANLTGEALVPRADYILAQDQYEEVNTLSERIYLLEKALRVAGLYNGNNKAIARLISEASMNEMIPCDEWAMFAERGGVKGNVDWFPLEMIVLALEKLSVQLQAAVAMLFQVTGMSDIIRGQSGQQATATEQAIKAKYAGVRVQDFQGEFAQHATDLASLKAEIISKHFDVKTIIERSNIMYTADAQVAEQAAALIKSNILAYRIEIKSETISATDYAQMQQERVAALGALTQFLQAMATIPPTMIPLLPYLMEMLKWGFAGFKGGATIEGVIDQAVAQVRQMMPQLMAPKPDPAMAAEKMRADTEMKKAEMDHQANQAKHQNEMTKIEAETKQTQVETQMDLIKGEAALRQDAIRSTLPQKPGAQEQPNGRV